MVNKTLSKGLISSLFLGGGSFGGGGGGVARIPMIMLGTKIQTYSPNGGDKLVTMVESV